MSSEWEKEKATDLLDKELRLLTTSRFPAADSQYIAGMLEMAYATGLLTDRQYNQYQLFIPRMAGAETPVMTSPST